MGLPRSAAIVRLYPPDTKPPPAARMSWNVFPPSVLSSSTPPSKPRLGSKSEASRLKLCRNVNRTQQSSKKLTNHPSSRLSLTTAGSSIKTALGAVSAGGIGGHGGRAEAGLPGADTETVLVSGHPQNVWRFASHSVQTKPIHLGLSRAKKRFPRAQPSQLRW